MEFNPPITERKTKELFNILSNNEKWTKEIQLLAEEELYRRNYTQQVIIKEKNKRIKTIQNFKERQNKIFDKNKIESYSAIEMLLIIAFFPFSFLIHLNPLSEFWRLDDGHFKKKIWQRILLITISILLWIQIIRLFV